MNKLTEALLLHCIWNDDSHWCTMNALKFQKTVWSWELPHTTWSALGAGQTVFTGSMQKHIPLNSINSDLKAIAIGCATALMYGRFEVLLYVSWTHLKWSQTDLGEAAQDISEKTTWTCGSQSSVQSKHSLCLEQALHASQTAESHLHCASTLHAFDQFYRVLLFFFR